MSRFGRPTAVRERGEVRKYQVQISHELLKLYEESDKQHSSHQAVLCYQSRWSKNVVEKAMDRVKKEDVV